MADTGQDDGHCWKFGIGFVVLGLCSVFGAGVFSAIHHGENGCWIILLGNYLFSSAKHDACPEPPQLEVNGKLIFERNDTIEVGAEAVYICSEAYQMFGPNRKVCHEEGGWIPEDQVFCFKESKKVKLITYIFFRWLPLDCPPLFFW